MQYVTALLSGCYSEEDAGRQTYRGNGVGGMKFHYVFFEARTHTVLEILKKNEPVIEKDHLPKRHRSVHYGRHGACVLLSAPCLSGECQSEIAHQVGELLVDDTNPTCVSPLTEPARH